MDGYVDAVPLGVLHSGRQFYCRIREDVDHALFVRSSDMMIHETTSGPFRREETGFAPRAPDGSDAEAAYQYAKRFIQMEVPSRPMLHMEMVTTEVYQAKYQIVSLGKREIDFLKEKVPHSPRNRVRLCIHENMAHELHEMVVVYMDQTYVRPNRHFRKDESMHILEGEADFYFFDDNVDLDNKITSIIDDNPLRQGRYSPGHHIPIESSVVLQQSPNSITIILAWRFAEMIIQKNRSYIAVGGKFIVPLPEFAVISKTNAKLS
ncbi:MAG: cupin fold metalloprotein, WbuC family [Proteobacteria bacterium]|nr:cupin fold metalloprotein, WbuC family [Pseudomonadota bacterium]